MRVAKPKVLYFDDNPAARTVIDSFLILLSFHVIVAHNSTEARELVGSNQLDLILLDSFFGDEHGLKVCRQLRIIYPVQPLIFYTDPSNDGQRTNALEAGATEFLAKPHFGQLRECVQRCVDLSEPNKHRWQPAERRLTGVTGYAGNHT